MKSDEAVYDTIGYLKEAIENGEVEPEEVELTLDNDCVSATSFEEDEDRKIVDETTYYYNLGSPRTVLEEALDVLGIPHRRP